MSELPVTGQILSPDGQVLSEFERHEPTFVAVTRLDERGNIIGPRVEMRPGEIVVRRHRNGRPSTLPVYEYQDLATYRPDR